MSAGRAVHPPSGQPPPRRTVLPGGATLDLERLATEVCRRYRAEFPDEQGRYGEAGVAWCVHDNQHLLNWAALEVQGYGPMQPDVAWLGGVLEARAFPLDRLARDLELAADVVGELVPEAPALLAAALRRSAAYVRRTPTFRPPA